MTQVISDERIAEMIAEPKLLPRDWQQQLANLRPKMDSKEASVGVSGTAGTQFRIIVRQHHQRSSDFSVILTKAMPTEETPARQQEFRLLRCDGSYHPHRNIIEGNLIDHRPHIHRATARYQDRGHPHDGYAVETDEYQDLAGAWNCFFDKVKLELPEGLSAAALPEGFAEV